MVQGPRGDNLRSQRRAQPVAPGGCHDVRPVGRSQAPDRIPGGAGIEDKTVHPVQIALLHQPQKAIAPECARFVAEYLMYHRDDRAAAVLYSLEKYSAADGVRNCTM